MLIKT